MKRIYLDNAATTKVDEEVLKVMLPYFDEKFGNASSSHLMGQEAKEAMEKSRKIIAKSINAKSREIYFTSGGTESNNWALKGLFFENYPQKNHIITTKIEHDCVLNSCRWLETQGAEVTYLDVDEKGFVDLEKLENSITDKTIVVSIIHGNNEIGVIQDLKKIAEICHAKGTLIHTDACQSFTKTEVDVKKMDLDLVTLNAHKIHGPKGVGALYIREGIKINPLAHGGGHEKGLRSGTENIPGIVGFAKSTQILKDKDIQQMKKLQEKLIKELLEIENVNINGDIEKRTCNNVNVCFNNIEGEAIGGYLENLGIFTSTGSACSSHKLEPSHVLMALYNDPVKANSSIRVSISKFTTEEEIDYFLENIKKIVNKLRRISAI